MDYSPEHRNWFDIMTTKRQSRMVFPALYKMQKALISTRENFAAEKAQIAQKVDDK